MLSLPIKVSYFHVENNFFVKRGEIDESEQYMGSWGLMEKRLAEVKKESLAAAEKILDGPNR